MKTLCAVALGCSSSTPTTSRVDSTQEQTPTITTKRPIITDDGQTTTESFADTNTTQMPVADPTRFNDGTRRAVDPDNTGINVRDRATSAKTPFDQNENQKDIDIAANIRKRVVDTQMSVNAQNAKIITQNGKVTLRGPVKSADETTHIEKLAQEVAGPTNVDNQLEVQP